MKEILVPDIDYNSEVKKCKTMEDILGKNGLMQRLLKDVMQQLLEAEMDEHLGRDRYERRNNEKDTNYRNGYSKKTVRSSVGELDLDIPRDRESSFAPVIVKKNQVDCSEFDKKIISLYARGLSTRDIQSEIEELYGVEISPTMVSRITDKVMGAAADWQNRMLDKIYPIIYMDALYYKVRDDNKIVSKAAYVCMAIDTSGHRDILGIWVGETEGAKFWLTVCNDLKNRGVDDILIACMDGLKGLPDAIKMVFPEVSIQNCIVHQIRNSFKYVASKDQKEFVRDLKCIYKAASEEAAVAALDDLKNKWNKKYSIVVDSWYNNWDKLSTFFKFPNDIRRIIYTTNSLEGFNRQLRKVTKTKTVFPNEEALKKSLYLATVDITKKWTTPIPNWGATLGQLTIFFEGRLEI